MTTKRFIRAVPNSTQRGVAFTQQEFSVYELQQFNHHSRNNGGHRFNKIDARILPPPALLNAGQTTTGPSRGFVASERRN
jgi:hypothetical protein